MEEKGKKSKVGEIIGVIIGFIILLVLLDPIATLFTTRFGAKESTSRLGFEDEEDVVMEEVIEPEVTTIPTLSDEELWNLLNSQAIYVEKIDVIPTTSAWGASCMLSAIFWNNSGTAIRDVTLGYLAWDTNGLPLLLYDDYLGDRQYVVTCNYVGINLLNGASYGENEGIRISDVDGSDVLTVSAVMVSCVDFDGNEYYNPYYEMWLQRYAGITLQ
jgi:hypothetical protein